MLAFPIVVGIFSGIQAHEHGRDGGLRGRISQYTLDGRNELCDSTNRFDGGIGLVQDGLSQFISRHSSQAWIGGTDSTAYAGWFPESGEKTRDRLWLVIVSAFAFVLAGSFVSIATAMFIATQQGGGKPGPVLPMFTIGSVLDVLSPLRRARERGRPD